MKTTIELPPYGVFPRSFRRLSDVSDPMSDWEPSLPMQERRKTFLKWRDAIRGRLSESIWPYFDRSGDSWNGASIDWCDDASHSEIEVMISELQGGNPKILEAPRLCPSPEFGDTHLQEFQVEDNPFQPAGINLRDYVCGLSEEQFEAARATIDRAYAGTKLSGLFWMKQEFVRPRPFQAAMIFGNHDFDHVRAYSGLHSSFHSGHCLEGIIFSAAVAENWLNDPDTYSVDQLEALARYSVDFGDRRVYAGVHYPSDNIGSWYIAMQLIPKIFANPAPIQRFVVNAIVQHSGVFQLINRNYSENELLAPAYGVMQEALGLNVA